MISGRETALSSFETALLCETSTKFEKTKIARVLVVLVVLFFTTLHSPAALSAGPALDSEAVLNVLNQDRIKYGLSALTADQKLQEAATAKALDILQNNYFAHISPAGRQPWDFIKNAGFKYSFAGENLAINYQNALELQNDFMNSPNHRENLLSPLFDRIGIAVMEGEFRGKKAVVTVEMFASPTETVAAK